MVDQASCSIKIVGNGNANMFVARALVSQERQSMGNSMARAKGLL